MGFQLLIVDDERIVRNSLARSLQRSGLEIRGAAGVTEARSHLRESAYDLLIVDYRLGDGTGLEVLADVKDMNPETEVIMLTAHGSVTLAVESMRAGAFDFLEKGSDPELMRHVVERALEQVRLRKEVENLARAKDLPGVASIVSKSAKMKELLATAKEYARSDVTILLQGETGSGKSLLAKYIHGHSERRDGPFITLNCCAIPHDLMESELFGYLEGAFTGASRHGKSGLIEEADEGTFFLDEIGDLQPELQAKLLLVLEKGEILRVGSVESRKVDVRFIAATNADLDAQLANGRFRRDLYYRLDVAPLLIPSLRDRREDIVPLADIFRIEFNCRLHKSLKGFTPQARDRLQEHAWPGNIRELRNVVERAVLLAKGDEIGDRDLRLGNAASDGIPDEVRIPIGRTSASNLLAQAQKELVERAWELSEGNQSRAAEILGVPRTTLQHHLRKWGLA